MSIFDKPELTPELLEIIDTLPPPSEEQRALFETINNLTMIRDPVEREVALGLRDARIAFSMGTNEARLDFFLPEHGVYIECKQYHTLRIAEQMSRANNVIVIQGIAAAKLFRKMISPSPHLSGAKL